MILAAVLLAWCALSVVTVAAWNLTKHYCRRNTP